MEFFDNDLGIIKITRNRLAKKVIARRKYNYIKLTVPFHYSESKIKSVFNELKPKILVLRHYPVYNFNPSEIFKTFSFEVHVSRNDLQNWYVLLKQNVLNISCAAGTDFNSENVQTKIKGYVEAALRSEAKKIISGKVEQFAQKYGFEYAAVKINGSKSRWGSCSSKKA